MVYLFIVAGTESPFVLKDNDGNVRGTFDSLQELFRHVGQNYNSYELVVDSSVVNKY